MATVPQAQNYHVEGLQNVLISCLRCSITWTFLDQRARFRTVLGVYSKQNTLVHSSSMQVGSLQCGKTWIFAGFAHPHPPGYGASELDLRRCLCINQCLLFWALQTCLELVEMKNPLVVLLLLVLEPLDRTDCPMCTG